ncbi:MAG: anaerobic ribonucleoside-triphosphate reductase activating protein, partial [Clostridia bacterium]|nr:anaerobic ribonucleoside-triphosphate reductase activating protein [Clostridia bacterium]
YVAMDIKNSPTHYARTAGLKEINLAPVQESIRLLMQHTTPYEFRTTVVRELHTPDDFDAIGQWIQGAEQYFIQAFTDRDSVPFAGFHAPSAEELHQYADTVSKYVKKVTIRGID